MLICNMEMIIPALRIKWANVCESDKVISNYELENICIPLKFIFHLHHGLYMALLIRMEC